MTGARESWREAAAEIGRRLDRVEARLARLEGAGVPAGAAADGPAEVAGAAAPAGAEKAPTTPPLALVGRTLLALGGAFLLRAASDAGALPRRSGAALGLLYAGLWLVLAERGGARRASASAALHTATGLAIAGPLLWEAATRFALVSLEVSCLLLAAFVAAGLAVAWRHDLPAVAWTTCGAGLASALALQFAGSSMAAPLVVQALLGVGAMWLGWRRGWSGIRWMTAIPSLLALGLFAVLAGNGRVPAAPAVAIAVLLLPVVLGLASIALGVARGAGEAGAFEWVVGPLLLAVGLGGALALAPGRTVAAALGAVAVAAGAGGYALAGSLAAGGRRGERSFALFTTLGQLAVLIGLGAILESPAGFSLATTGVGIGLAALAARRQSAVLVAQSALATLVAGLWSGLLWRAGHGLVAPVSVPWPDPGPAAPGVLAGAAAVLALVYRTRPARGLAALPRPVLLATFVLAAAGIAVRRLAPLVAGEPGSASADAGAVAALRTALLALLAVSLAVAARRAAPLAELARLVSPCLVAIAVKLVVEDLPRGRAATIFAALASAGLALLVAGRPGGRTPERGA